MAAGLTIVATVLGALLVGTWYAIRITERTINGEDAHGTETHGRAH
ncbi:hypothetical protein VB773_10730 [Haloarculaceae archaeon H-GB2-1]|nr:hypothetical protein [Haloarculaceae archaeon H-GB1-1]MEA5386469.1 hypothetical protein [Haloarculaceae archaeon H-GB11]MEA5407982.1 hypothetical protein [Haloarculaceae archaeon H-GB2-1]